MTDKLVDFLNEMDKNEELKQNYIKDPKGTAEKYGLEPKDVEICAKNDIEAMKKRAAASGGENLSIDVHM